MASLRHERRIQAPARVVWDVVRRPDSITEWFPGVVKCLVEGMTRVITLASGLEMVEEIMTIDNLQRRFAYRITTAVYTFHFATIDVIALSDDESLCVYSTTAEPDALALIVAGGTIGALDEICRLAELRAKE